jgi:hypothetical protein
MSMNVLQLADQLRTEADAYRYLEQLRWGDRPVCPHCGTVGEHYFLTPANGRTRKTASGLPTERRVWKCSQKGCRKQFSVTTGTIMHGSKNPGADLDFRHFRDGVVEERRGGSRDRTQVRDRVQVGVGT